MADKKLVFNPANADIVYQAAPVEQVAFNPANAIDIDPETGRPFDPQIPTKMAQARSAEANAAYNAANPQSMTSKAFEALGNAWDASKLAGLTPEVAPLGGAFRTSAAYTMANLPKVQQAGTVAANVASKAANVATYPIKAAGQILGETASDFVKKAYQIGKGGDKQLASAWRQGKAAGLPADEKGLSAVGNYFRAFFPEANVSDIAKAKDMSKQAGGVWDVAKKAQEAEAKMAQISPRYNWSLPKDATLVLPENLQVSPNTLGWNQAFRAGQEATWLPSGKTFVDVLKNPRTFPSLISPRLEANLGYGIGAGERIGGQLYNQLPQLTDADLYNLSLLSPRIYGDNQ
jgi:hypothetical protein